jgi:hypothetical protein
VTQPSWECATLNHELVRDNLADGYQSTQGLFCMVLREIATGEDGQPLSSLEAQRRAREVLTDCGYSWPGQASDSAQQSSGTMGPHSSTDEAMVRQHLKEQLRQLRSLNGKTRRLDDLAV